MTRIALTALIALSAAAPLAAADPKPAKLKVLYITGGGWHDYKTLAKTLTEKMAEWAHVEFEVKWGLDVFKDPKFADGFDAIVYNLCFSEPEVAPGFIDRIRAVTKAGKPTVMVHCAMHTFWKSEEWAECCGQVTRNHERYRSFSTAKADKDHPITKTWPDDWTTPGDELYRTIKLYEGAHPLLQVKSEDGKLTHTVCWTFKYGNGKVFATTLGHDMKTAGRPEYHRLLAYGLLWSAGKLGDDGKPAAGFAGPGPQETPKK